MKLGLDDPKLVSAFQAFFKEMPELKVFRNFRCVFLFMHPRTDFNSCAGASGFFFFFLYFLPQGRFFMIKSWWVELAVLDVADCSDASFRKRPCYLTVNR